MDSFIRGAIYMSGSGLIEWCVNYQTSLFDPEMWPKQVLSLWIRVDLGMIAVKGYSTLLRTGASSLNAV